MDDRGPTRMKLGIQLPEVEWEVPFDQLIEMAQLAERAGFDSVWLGDHLLYDLPVGARGPWEVWTSLAAIAASTEHVELGPLVASTSFHSPPMLAKQAATVDAISGGRLILGDERATLRESFDEVVTMLRSSYLVGYRPPQDSDTGGKEGLVWHQVDLETPGHDVEVFEADMTQVAALRKRHVASFAEKHQTKLTYTGLIVKAAVRALQEFPLLNASIDWTPSPTIGASR